MSRPSAYNINLTPDEYVETAQVIDREYKNFLQLSPEDREKMPQSSRIAISTLKDRTDGPFMLDGLTKGHILKCTRVQIRLLQRLVTDKLSRVLTSVIPGYQDRISNAPDKTERARLETYLSKAQKTAQTLTSILTQINGRL